jgi:hypothetical protein
LHDFASELSDTIVDEVHFVCSIRNTLCLSEVLSHAVVLEFDKMSLRKKQPIMISVGGKDIPATYYSASKFAQHFSKYFKLKKLIGLPAIMPPAYLSNYYVRLGKSVSFVERLESALSSHFPFNRYGDQTLFVFEKK